MESYFTDVSQFRAKESLSFNRLTTDCFYLCNMNIEERKNAFVQLGKVLSNFTEKNLWESHACGLTKEEFEEFETTLVRAKVLNPWFTEDQVRKAISGIVSMLDKSRLEQWIDSYESLEETNKAIGVVMAGNIPIVGFHDFLCVLISGNKLAAKLSSEDKILLPMISQVLIQLEPRFQDHIEFVERLQGFDAVIATGSNNSARYFESYFKEYPAIIRKNRTSVAVFTGNETEEELTAFAEDVFLYFGKGCRNVTKIYVPKEFDLNKLFQAFYPYQEIVNHNKYANNYDYNKAVYLMNQVELIENGFLLMKQDSSLHSPLSVLNYEYYNSLDEVIAQLEEKKDTIQCVVGTNFTPFGKAQTPDVSDYADGVDTLEFLLALK